MDIIKKLAEEFKIRVEQVEKTVALIDDGNTIPFIARYRKEETGSLDDGILRDLDDRLTYLRNIEKRKEEVKNLITEMGKMTDEISVAIDNAQTITEVDDIYRPFRPHRKTRASVAKEKGLEPLAELILAQENRYEPSLEEIAEGYVNEELKVKTPEFKERIANGEDLPGVPVYSHHSGLVQLYTALLHIDQYAGSSQIDADITDTCHYFCLRLLE